MLDVVPIFVLGAPHSGTSILYNMIALHPATTWISQYSLRAREVPDRRRIPGSESADRLLRQISRHDWRKSEHRVKSRLLPHPREAWDVWSHYLEAGDAAGDVRASDLRATIDAFCARSKREFFVAKTPRFTNHIAVLSSAYPSAGFVHIVRDGRAAALSIWAKMRKADPDAPLERACERWINGVSHVRAAVSSIDLLEIRYEDLCDDVQAVLGTVFEHATLPPVPSLLDRVPNRLTTSNRARIECASPEELDRITHVQGELLREYGYV